MNSSEQQNDHEMVLSLVRFELENQKFLIRTTLSIGAFLLVAAAGFASYFVGSGMSAAREDILQLTEARLDSEIRDRSNQFSDMDSLILDISKAASDYELYSESIDALSSLQQLAALDEIDPYGVYERLSSLAEIFDEGRGRTLTNVERAAAAALLDSAMEGAIAGRAEPNTIFNTGVLASQLRFTEYALSLATLAAHYRPTPSHQIFASEQSEILGVSYQFDGVKLETIELEPAEVRENAWVAMLNLASAFPLEQTEQVYSRLVNTAVRNEGLGYYRDAVDAIESASERSGVTLNSYVLVSLARLIAFQSEPNWRARTWDYMEQAVEALSQESQVSSWHEHSKRSLVRMSHRLDSLDQLVSIGELHGLEATFWLL